MTAQQPDVAGAVLALDRAMIALAIAKSVLLGETSRPLSVTAPPEGLCGAVDPNLDFMCDRPAGHDGRHMAHTWDSQPLASWAAAEPFPHFPHLPQHTNGNPICGLCGIDHDAAARLAPPAGYSLRSVSIPPQETA